MTVCVALGAAVAAPAVRAQSAPVSGPAITAADIRFMQEMIGHHQQAVEMTALIATRTRRADIRTLGERISVSQADEIAMMRRWLATHADTLRSGDGMTGHAAQDHTAQDHTAQDHTAQDHTAQDHTAQDHAAHDHAAMMPGMLTPAQLLALHRATGARFDRLFLQGMIQHHAGALAMVESLRASTGAAQDPFINRFIIDISADQRAEITRMRRMLFRK